jgi:hypothetical protein
MDTSINSVFPALWIRSILPFVLGIALTHIVHTSSWAPAIFEYLSYKLLSLSSILTAFVGIDRQILSLDADVVSSLIKLSSTAVVLIGAVETLYHYDAIRDLVQRCFLHKSKHFRLMDLPQELRDKIHEEILGDITQVPLQAHAPRDVVGYMKAAVFGPVFQNIRPGFGIMLANRQLHEEFMSLLFRRTTFTFRWGHGHPNSFPLQDTTLNGIQSLSLRLAVTPDMLGLDNWLYLATHPAAMELHLSSPHFAWQLRESLTDRLASLPRLRRLGVHVQAIPDHLSNPIDIWLCTLRALRQSGIESLTEVTFGLKDPTNDVNKAIRVKGGGPSPLLHLLVYAPHTDDFSQINGDGHVHMVIIWTRRVHRT